ncbi:MAG: hypothetical protein AAF196_04600 [Planctomycetota bacterium]
MLLVLLSVALGSVSVDSSDDGSALAGSAASSTNGLAPSSCVECHAGIEDIHPGFRLSCTDCHGGDAQAKTKEGAHVMPRSQPPGDERVLPIDYDLAWQRFVNPSNLRVAPVVCGDCHQEVVDHVLKSLHATTSGHLGDGYYEHGLVDFKTPRFGVFPIRDEDGDIPEGALESVVQVPPFQSRGDRNEIATHFSDLPRKACMNCHLWSVGRAVDGRLGLDGDYRGEGCAACHVTYSDDGRSRSGDRSAVRDEPGHPLQHRFTAAPPTETCARCHYGDASIGLHFRGLAQLVPGMPAGPDVEGTTNALKNGQFYIEDEDLTPPDIHHEAGMHCIDCHTSADTMGDGNLWPQMDHAVEIECSSCHGTLEKVSDLQTSHGRRVTNLGRDGDDFFLTSKVTGKRHRVKQVVHVIDKTHPDYNPRAREAMTSDHARMECYTCHNGWNVDFFGFHFDRNEQFTQLDLISGERTEGRVTTQEKVFATFNQLRLGWNHEGMIAPYLVGFSTIGSARGRDGELFLHQATPETDAGLSGVTLVPHQMHTTRPEARSCAECHRAPTTYGLGSVNFRLTREFGYAVTGGGFHTVAIDGRTPARTQTIAELEFEEDPIALAIDSDPVHARAKAAYVATEQGSLIIVDLSNPGFPSVRSTLKRFFTDPRRMLIQGGTLYVAEGPAGVSVFDLSRSDKPKPLSRIPTADARDLALAWPWLVVADGAGGVKFVDVRDLEEPRVLSEASLSQGDQEIQEALDVDVLFQYSRTRRSRREDGLVRSRSRHIAAVAGGLDGIRLIDFTDPEHPVVLHGRTARETFNLPRGDVRGVALNTVFDIGSEGGGLKSGERDYLYVYASIGPNQNRQQRIYVYDITDPVRPRRARGERPRVYGGTGELVRIRSYNEPFLTHGVLAVGAGGIGSLIDVSKVPSTGPTVRSVIDGLQGVRDFAIEEFAFDRLQDEQQRPIMDISHENCRFLDRDELLRVLSAEIPLPEDETDQYGFLIEPQRERNR